MSSKTARALFRPLLAVCLVLVFSSTNAASIGSSPAVLLYSQPHDGTGALLPSSRLIGNSSDSDQYVWDDFISTSGGFIGEVKWRGARNITLNTGGPVQYFTIEIYADLSSIEPDVNNRLFQYQTPGNAGEIFAGNFKGVAMYDYDVVLSTPFVAQANTRYWLLIEAFQNYVPDWGIAVGTGGTPGYYKGMAKAGDIFYQIFRAGGSAFALYQPGNISSLYLPAVLR